MNEDRAAWEAAFDVARSRPTPPEEVERIAYGDFDAHIDECFTIECVDQYRHGIQGFPGIRPVSMLLEASGSQDRPGYVVVKVRVGRTPGARGIGGEIIVATDEWEEMRRDWIASVVCPVEVG